MSSIQRASMCWREEGRTCRFLMDTSLSIATDSKPADRMCLSWAAAEIDVNTFSVLPGGCSGGEMPPSSPDDVESYRVWWDTHRSMWLKRLMFQLWVAMESEIIAVRPALAEYAMLSLVPKYKLYLSNIPLHQFHQTRIFLIVVASESHTSDLRASPSVQIFFSITHTATCQSN